MAIKISTVFIFLGVPAVLAQNGHIGYDYRAPAVPSQLPSNLRPNYNLQQYYYNSAPDLQNGFLPSPSYQHHYSGDHYRNQHTQTQQASNYNYQSYNSAQSSYQNVNYNSYNQNIGNGNPLGAQNALQNVQASSAYNPGFANAQPQQPIITKHIYFHLPPEEDTTTASTPVAHVAPKKTYNIIFIKLPSQKSSSAVQLQQMLNQQAAVASKTLIYVLVKKPELLPITAVTSKPEVFFVKYKEPRNVAQPVNSNLLQVPLPQGGSSGLLPGQVNGHGAK